MYLCIHAHMHLLVCT